MNRKQLRLPFVACGIYLLTALNLPALFGQASFEVIEIDPQIGDVCYAVNKADVDGDGKMDIVAISESTAVWYRNPDWKKFTMIDGVLPRDHVCIAPHDIDGDGQVDFAIGAGWPQNGGNIYWIRRKESLDEPWTVHEIGAEPWTHRMSFADVLGNGETALVVSPLNATTGAGVRLLAYPIPADPTTNAWQPIVIDGSLNRVHNHFHTQFRSEPIAGEASVVTLAASEEGLSLLQHAASKGFALKSLVPGAQGETPAEKGAGEIKALSLGQQQWLLATIEPMHGNQVVVYSLSTEAEPIVSNRRVLDESFNQGHAVAIADLFGDERPEIVAGFRQPRNASPVGPGIIIYQAQDEAMSKWTAIPLDLTKMACEDLLCHDFDGDGKFDVVAGGRATRNVRLYRNQCP